MCILYGAYYIVKLVLPGFGNINVRNAETKQLLINTHTHLIML